MKTHILLHKDSAWETLTTKETNIIRRQAQRIVFWIARGVKLKKNEVLSCVVHKNITRHRYTRVRLDLSLYVLGKYTLQWEGKIRFIPKTRKFLLGGRWFNFKKLIDYCVHVFKHVFNDVQKNIKAILAKQKPGIA